MQARDWASRHAPARDAVFLDELCPKLRARRWRQSLHQLTQQRCIYCGCRSESIDHVLPKSRGGPSVNENCVPACLACNGRKGDSEAFCWYRQQPFYDPRRAMAIRAWTEGDMKLAARLLDWTATGPVGARETSGPAPPADLDGDHQTLQATGPLWRWQMAA
ncbi:HNH endonuclease [Cyanobium sp. NIES-981]|uniref:HNH endonuclease n=1 Tax=Cyanobium sp. NIES-981 TaxID=1851505 RepID=UPI0007DCE17B|nr:HNH endonuclease signature motif containing protein [Cyanobium sp. NIES-981]SBO44082.1 HNH nuclease [Cyanobium sp. NIES-981]